MTHPEELYNYDILVFKLTSGDTVVSYADISDPDTVRLYRPLEIRYMTGGRRGHGLMPWMPFSDSEVFNIHRRNIIVAEKPIKIMIEGYMNSQEMYDEEPARYKYTEEQNEDWESQEEYDLSQEEGVRFADEKSAQIYEAMIQKVSNTQMKVH